MRKVVSTLDRVICQVGVVAGVLLVGISVAVTYDVIMRYFLRAPTLWSVEVTGYMLLIAVFLSFAYTESVGGHVKVDIVFERLPPRIQVWVKLATSVLAFLFAIVFTWQTAQLAIKSFILAERSPSLLSVLLWPIYTFMPLGCVLFILECLRSLIKSIVVADSLRKVGLRRK